jgi:hypothetical protein
MERMKEETRALTDAAHVAKGEALEKLFREYDRYDLLAIDWVNGD